MPPLVSAVEIEALLIRYLVSQSPLGVNSHRDPLGKGKNHLWCGGLVENVVQNG